MLTFNEQTNRRRCYRMEALASDLAGLKPGHKPTELELMRARELYAALARVFIPEPDKPETPESPAPESPNKKPSGKK